MVLVVLLSVGVVQAQDLLKGRDLSQVRVDQLSDADIAKLKAQLGSSGMTIDQAEQMALAKGMLPAEFAKLKARVLGTSNALSATGRLKVQNSVSVEKVITVLIHSVPKSLTNKPGP